MSPPSPAPSDESMIDVQPGSDSSMTLRSGRIGSTTSSSPLAIKRPNRSSPAGRTSSRVRVGDESKQGSSDSQNRSNKKSRMTVDRKRSISPSSSPSPSPLPSPSRLPSTTKLKRSRPGAEDGSEHSAGPKKEMKKDSALAKPKPGWFMQEIEDDEQDAAASSPKAYNSNLDDMWSQILPNPFFEDDEVLKKKMLRNGKHVRKEAAAARWGEVDEEADARERNKEEFEKRTGIGLSSRTAIDPTGESRDAMMNLENDARKGTARWTTLGEDGEDRTVSPVQSLVYPDHEVQPNGHHSAQEEFDPDDDVDPMAILPSSTKKRKRLDKDEDNLTESNSECLERELMVDNPSNPTLVPTAAAAPQIQVNLNIQSAAWTLPAPTFTLDPSIRRHVLETKTLVIDHLMGRVPPLVPRPTLAGAEQVNGQDALVEESLVNLVELLRGTVERGEGNSCLIQGIKGSGKTTILNQAIEKINELSEANPEEIPAPMVIRLSALMLKDDRSAIREIGRQVGINDLGDDFETEEELEDNEQDSAVVPPTTLPSHLLAILTAPSKKSIIIVLEEFDIFAGFGRGGRQMLLYCLLDVVQSVRPRLGALSGRGLIVIGVTSRIDALHLLEKRVKSRFSHRIIRVNSILHGDRSADQESATSAVDQEITGNMGPRWKSLLSKALVPWYLEEELGSDDASLWRRTWRESIDSLLENPQIQNGLQRLNWISTDIRMMLKVLIRPMGELTPDAPFLTPGRIQLSFVDQAEGAGWGHGTRRLRGLSLPCLAILASIKDLGERGILDFNFEHVFFTYGEFAKNRLIGSAIPRHGRQLMKDAFTSLVETSIIYPCSTSVLAGAQSFSTSVSDFAKHRCAIEPTEIVEFFRGEGGKGVMTQLSRWGKKWDI
ncbi:Origin recognition complex, subunit 4 [Phaffia rhodozyma]|uniref:Origin recognition complex, subunit 4 n=1 Tax=Phaffia rhodozyma TaxID=264483 RepID=A0A0F7SSM2_PHARH|nr:Origin recognition complex, subunit 4 [Phaffia rhodozyma]